MDGHISLGRAFEESFDRQFNNYIQEALLSPVEIDSHDYRLRKDDMYSHGTLLWSSDGISHNASHRQIEAFPRGALQSYTEAVPHDALGRTMVNPHSTLLPLLQGITLSPLSSFSAMEDDNQTVVFQLLCPVGSVGGVIESLTDIKNLESVRGASIDVGDTLPDCDECLITFTSSEVGLRLSRSHTSVYFLLSVYHYWLMFAACSSCRYLKTECPQPKQLLAVFSLDYVRFILKSVAHGLISLHGSLSPQIRWDVC